MNGGDDWIDASGQNDGMDVASDAGFNEHVSTPATVVQSSERSNFNPLVYDDVHMQYPVGSVGSQALDSPGPESPCQGSITADMIGLAGWEQAPPYGDPTGKIWHADRRLRSSGIHYVGARA